MQLHDLPKKNTRRQTRVGRGGKRGTTSGRGQKGQKSRSGRRIRPAVRDLILRIAKKRGFRNKPKSDKFFVVSLADIGSKIAGGSFTSPVAVTPDFLRKVKLLPKHFFGSVKILGNGGITVAIKVQGVSVSESVKEKIEKAGGSVGTGRNI